MAAVSTIVAAGALVVGAASYANARSDAKDAQAARTAAANDQKQAREEQRAQQNQQAAEEARRQARERRIRTAQIMQSAENSGVAYGSGESGAIGSISTQYNANRGANLGALQTANNISALNQSAANNMTQASIFENRSQQNQQLFSLSMQAFNGLNGYTKLGSLFK